MSRVYFLDAEPLHVLDERETLTPWLPREAWLYSAPDATLRSIAAGVILQGLDVVELHDRAQLEAQCLRARGCALLVFAAGMEDQPVAFLSHIRQLIGTQVPVMVVSPDAGLPCLPDLIQPAHTDFVLKGAEPGELALRLHLLLDRVRQTSAPEQLVFGPYVVHLARKVITRNGEDLPVSQVECELAILMFQNLGQVVLREKLIATVEAQVRRVRMRTTRSPDIQMSRVRKVLQLEAHGYALKAVYGVGYRLDAVPVPLQQAQRSS